MSDLGAKLPAFLEKAYPEFLGPSWFAWSRVFLPALFGLPLTGEALELFTTHTGRTQAPSAQAREGWFIVGRRGGKTRITALLAVFLACVKTYRLSPGERGIVMLPAADRRQARVLKRYIAGLLNQRPEFAAMVLADTAEKISLSDGIDVEIHTSSFKAIRGYTCVAAICDELAFWATDEAAANPDVEILNALRPAMATVEGSLLLCLSSPYARRGSLWAAFDRHFGSDGDVLVINAPTVVMNPTVPAAVIQSAYADDEAAAAAEYGAEFRRDIEKFVMREIVEAVTVPQRQDLPPHSDVSYTAFCDPSGGSSDSMTLCLAHRDGRGRGIVDALVEKKAPFSPDVCVEEFARVLKTYHCHTVTGDRYAGEWPRAAFQRHGITYGMSEQTKGGTMTTDTTPFVLLKFPAKPVASVQPVAARDDIGPRLQRITSRLHVFADRWPRQADWLLAFTERFLTRWGF